MSESDSREQQPEAKQPQTKSVPCPPLDEMFKQMAAGSACRPEAFMVSFRQEAQAPKAAGETASRANEGCGGDQ